MGKIDWAEVSRVFLGFPLYIFAWVCAGRLAWKLGPLVLHKIVVAWAWLWY